MHPDYENLMRCASVFFVCGLSFITVKASADDSIRQSVNPENGLKSWSYQGNGLAIELIQVPPDFIRASYGSRGLPTKLSEAVATRCVFGTIVRNVADGPLSYRVADWWYVNEHGRRLPIKTKSEWLEEWHGMGVRFSWSILADEPTFDVGDWLQGFTTMAEPHGSSLSLTVVWSFGETRYEKTFPRLECAPAPSDA